MKVSVATITYNHEEFISQAVSSVLTQKTNFEYELVIGEDCSTDRTREILFDFKSQFPDKIRLLNNETNIGAIRNFVATLNSCRGQYIALLEGDDYWTSPEKLQKQVDFLDNHPECSICFHPVKILDANSNSFKPFLIRPLIIKDSYSIEDLLDGNFIPTCSVMFRNKLFGQIPDWIFDLKMADWPLHLLNAQYGNIGYIDEIMAVYRLHPGSMWSSQPATERYQEVVRILEIMDKQLNYRYSKLIRSIKYKKYFWIASLYLQKNEYIYAKRYAIKSLPSIVMKDHIPFKSHTSLFLRLTSPSIYRQIQKWRRKDFTQSMDGS